MSSTSPSWQRSGSCWSSSPEAGRSGGRPRSGAARGVGRSLFFLPVAWGWRRPGSGGTPSSPCGTSSACCASLKTRERGQFRHGRIVHGRQLLEAGQRRVPTAYYGERSGVGLVMRMHRADRPRRVGVVGLGIGTLAAYAKAGDEFACYELDPDVVRIARREFSFLADAPARPEVILGDGGWPLERERDRGTSRRVRHPGGRCLLRRRRSRSTC